ncbi:MAG: hypothetical protein ACR2PX_18680 [Endozoicomonas sp.]|uniref:hypothetical protein n=1 Tax=Endozoicomonas sp. TaxID=1892382 RepID=UPI003D9AFD0B
MYIYFLISILALMMTSLVWAGEADEVMGSDTRIIHYDGMLVTASFPIQQWGNQTEAIDVNWKGHEAFAPPLTLCSTAALYQNEDVYRNVSISREFNGQY